MDSLLDDFQRVVRAMLERLPGDTGGPRLVDVLAAHLGIEPHTLAVVAAPVPPHRLVDADIALAEVAEDDPRPVARGHRRGRPAPPDAR